jgi:type I restriction enzyme S subunit
MTWLTAPLRKVAPPVAAKIVFSPDDRVWQLSLDQIESETGEIVGKRYAAAADAGTSTFCFDAGNVLYSKLRPYLNKVAIPDEAGIATTELIPLRPDPKTLNPRFLAYYLRSPGFVNQASHHVAGAKMPRVVMDWFWEHEAPISSPKEQSRIVELLDEADRLRRTRREADAKAARILPALFLKMFGDPATNPMKWPVVPLSDFVNAVSRRNPSTSPDEPFQYIDIAGVDGELGLITAVKSMVGRDAPSRARQVVKWRDTVVSTVRPYLRATALVPKELDNQIASTGFCILRPRESNGYAWLFQLTRLQWFTEQLNARARGASYPAVTDADIFQLLIPLPCDSKIFEEFSGQYESVSKVLLTAGASSEKVDALFNLMLQRAFSGELTAKWREGHMNELLAEMAQQARVLNLPMPEEPEALP